MLPVRSEFVKNVLTLMSGTMLAQVLPLLFAPVMTRIFNPADFGALGLYMAISGLMSVLVTSHYNRAILIPKDRREAINLVALCIAATIVVSALLLLVVVCFSTQIFGYATLGGWLYTTPLAVLFAGISSALNNWANRRRNYRHLAFSKLIGPLCSIPIQLVFGLLYKGPMGLLLAYIIGQFAYAAFLAWEVVQNDLELFKKYISAYRIRFSLRRHNNFMVFALPADAINLLINQLPVLSFSHFFSPDIVGSYNLSQRMLGLPSTFITSSVVDVFRERAVSDYNTIGNCLEIYRKTFYSLVLLGSPLLIIVFWGPELFSFIFGEKWRLAGEYSRILSVLFYLRFVVSPLSYVYFIVGRQKEDFIIHIALLVMTFLSFYYGYHYFNDTKIILVLYTICFSSVYLIWFFRSLMFSRGGYHIQGRPVKA